MIIKKKYFKLLFKYKTLITIVFVLIITLILLLLVRPITQNILYSSKKNADCNKCNSKLDIKEFFFSKKCKNCEDMQKCFAEDNPYIEINTNAEGIDENISKIDLRNVTKDIDYLSEEIEKLKKYPLKKKVETNASKVDKMMDTYDEIKELSKEAEKEAEKAADDIDF